MNGRTLSRRAASVVAIAAATAALGTTTAAAEPKITDQPKTPLDIGIEHLTEVAGHDENAQVAVQDAVKTAKLVAAANLGTIGFTPFAYAAPTIGCGYSLPFSMTSAAGVPGIESTGNGVAGKPGTLRFQANVQQVGFSLSSGLSVVWLNINNGRSGIDMLDEQTEYNLPALAKTVDSGAGTVIATLWGTVDYPAARCLVFPTVGLFTVPEIPVAPATTDPAAPATTPAAAPDSGSGNMGSSDAN
ncbi:hypothetical protein AB0N05_00275 [Nocardia sp. NPDC051030]|uniref:hypothetical protein n=1 Tax=Nocardia sp. NPDC051030 TaxID=3155162 RepID=UPI00342E68DF